MNRHRIGFLLLALGIGAGDCLAGGGQLETRRSPEVIARPVEPSRVTTGVTSAASMALRKRLNALETLTADFEQRVTDTEGFEVQNMTGKMTVARPGYIHWLTEPPYEQLLISDTETLWLYDKDLEQVTVRPFMRDIVNSPAMLFIGDITDMDEKYDISRTAVDEGGSEFSLVPVDDSAVYRKLTITFAGDEPVSMGLWDSLGQITRIRFSNVQLNQDVSPALFEFQIPEGVDVLHDD